MNQMQIQHYLIKNKEPPNITKTKYSNSFMFEFCITLFNIGIKKYTPTINQKYQLYENGKLNI